MPCFSGARKRARSVDKQAAAEKHCEQTIQGPDRLSLLSRSCGFVEKLELCGSGSGWSDAMQFRSDAMFPDAERQTARRGFCSAVDTFRRLRGAELSVLSLGHKQKQHTFFETKKDPDTVREGKKAQSTGIPFLVSLSPLFKKQSINVGKLGVCYSPGLWHFFRLEFTACFRFSPPLGFDTA